MMAFDGLSAAEVGSRLQISDNAAFVARHRVVKRLRELAALYDE